MKFLKILAAMFALLIAYMYYDLQVCPPLIRAELNADVDRISQAVIAHWLEHDELPNQLVQIPGLQDDLNFSRWNYRTSYGYMSFDFEVSDYDRCGWTAGCSRIVRWGDGSTPDPLNSVGPRVPQELRDRAEPIARRLLQHYVEQGFFPSAFEALGVGWKYKAPTESEPGFLMPDPPQEPVQYYLYFDFASVYTDT
jgi:hypothetical protein